MRTRGDGCTKTFYSQLIVFSTPKFFQSIADTRLRLKSSNVINNIVSYTVVCAEFILDCGFTAKSSKMIFYQTQMKARFGGKYLQKKTGNLTKQTVGPKQDA